MYPQYMLYLKELNSNYHFLLLFAAELRFENDTGTLLLLQFADEVPRDVVRGDTILMQVAIVTME